MENKNVPNIVFKTISFEGDIIPGACPLISWRDLSSAEIFKNKKVVLFALPGAFTPTCSSKQLPGYENKFAEFKQLNVDDIYCLAVNDAFVMNAWVKCQNLKNVKILPDGNGDFTREMGMLVKKNNLGFGERSWRYSMLIENGVISKIFEEAGKMDNFDSDPFEVSDADTMLKYLKNKN